MNIDELIERVYQKDYSALKRLIAGGADLNSTDSDGRTPLMHAVLDDEADPQMVRFLANNGANPDTSEPVQKWTALHFAARDQKLPIVAALSEYVIKIDPEDVFGNTPLWRCVMSTRVQPDIVRLLLSKGADPLKKNRHGASPKDIAERMGNTELAGMLTK
jgi:uncharacterized protein